MRRLVGAALLCIGAAAPGFALAARLGRRVTDLEAMRAGVLAIERGLRSGLLPLEELLRQAARAAGGRGEVFFARCADGLAGLSGQSFSGLWEAELAASPLELEGGERGELRRLGGVLGRYDAAGQSAALSAAAQELSACLEQARERQGRLGRVYRAVGVCAGVFLAILLW